MAFNRTSTEPTQGPGREFYTRRGFFAFTFVGPVAAGAAGLAGVSAAYDAGKVILTMSKAVRLSGDALDVTKWHISCPGKSDLVVSAVALQDDNFEVALTASEPSTGTWTVTIPDGIVSIEGVPYSAPATLAFIQSGTGPTILIGVCLDARRIQIVYSEAVNQNDAQTVANYEVSGGITVSQVMKITDSVYQLRTREAVRVGISHLVTVTNVRDTAGNLI